MAMGFCDLMPGVSGSSMIHLLGYYEELITAVSRPQRHLIFLVVLGSGVLTSLSLFAGLFYQALMHPFFRPCLFFFFIGLSLVCAANALNLAKRRFTSVLIGALCSAALTVLAKSVVDGSALSTTWLFPAGILAGIALLIPAISGAQILYMIGVYPMMIEALARLTRSADMAAFFILLPLGAGTLLGFAIASRFIKGVLRRFSESVHGFFAGFIFLSLPRLWPFERITSEGWTYWFSLMALFLGIGIAIGLSSLAGRQKKGATDNIDL